jgi:hypothetical protein
LKINVFALNKEMQNFKLSLMNKTNISSEHEQTHKSNQHGQRKGRQKNDLQSLFPPFDFQIL